MKKVNDAEAREIINNNKGFVAIFWYSSNCPVCEHFFKEEVPKIIEAKPDWNFFKINFEDHIGDNNIMFEANQMPMGYFFRDQDRLYVGEGFAPADQVQLLMNQLESPEYKTEREIEEEQLAILDD